jgi:FAD/FMN-containing dehydrogenase
MTDFLTTEQEHKARVARLQQQLRESSGPVRLKKRTSNLFRPRGRASGVQLDVSDLNHVISIEENARTASVEGMIPYWRLVDAVLPSGFAPAVVPELKSITVGGATTGLGIESSSFRYGLVHETVLDMDVLLSDGSIKYCSPTKNAALFYGFPNSYGSLGYAVRLTIKLIPAKRYVRVSHERFTSSGKFFAAVRKEMLKPTSDYFDGVVFSENDLVLTRGTITDDDTVAGRVQRPSDYTWMKQYWRSLRTRKDDLLTTKQYLWRWDTDWFWCSKNVGAQFLPLRLVLGPKLLNSISYQRVMRASGRFPLKHMLAIPKAIGLSKQRESVIQDVDIPLDKAASFLAAFEQSIPIRPIWVCPFIVTSDKHPLYRLTKGKPYVNFGFWDTMPTDKPEGHYNKIVESLVSAHDGKKSLYSSSYFTREEFWRIYDRTAYDALKRTHDKNKRFPDLYEKTVKRG